MNANTNTLETMDTINLINTINGSDSEIEHNEEGMSSQGECKQLATGVITKQTVEGNMHELREKYKSLNPVRRARKLQFNETGDENPNLPKQNNGLNAWISTNIANTSIDSKEEDMAKYAKKNADTSKFYDIDVVPQRGPITDNHPLKIDTDPESEKMIQKAKNLINNNDIPICRNTGVRRIEDHKSHQQVPSARARSRSPQTQHT